jgi:hypothetical protein
LSKKSRSKSGIFALLSAFVSTLPITFKSSKIYES